MLRPKRVLCSAMLALASASVLLAPSAEAALVLRAGGTMLYDSDINVTWISNMALGGVRSWDDTKSWAEGLTYGGGSDWVMPSHAQLIHLFVTELGQEGLANVFYSANKTPDQIANTGLFSGLYSSGDYWSSDTLAVSTNYVRVFGAGDAYTGAQDKTLVTSGLAVAVRQGDVAAAVPEPGSVGLAAIALALALTASKRRRR